MTSPIIASKSMKIQYGTNLRLSFTIGFPTLRMIAPGGVNVDAPTAGTLTIAGVTITLGTGDVKSTAAVAAKIAATAISGYTVLHDPIKAPSTVILVDDRVGVQTAPTVVLGTATNIIFKEQELTQGVAMPAAGAQEDIDIGGKAPITFTVKYSGATSPTLAFSNGTPEQQARNALTYGAAVTLATVNGVSNSYTVTTPMRYAKLTTISGNTTAALYIS